VEPALTCPAQRHAPRRLQKPYDLLPLAISRQSQAPLGAFPNRLLLSALGAGRAGEGRDRQAPGGRLGDRRRRQGEVCERRSDDACADRHCAHRKCWTEEAHVAELTGLLREGPDGDQLKGWPKTMRVFARRERPLELPGVPVPN
jgi:hypothetical protein